ncbi:H-2 class I histocompatibility antigen, Q10 alpha chain-like [Anolis sagrei]|uniref:H-2 class I histocompatibility antigen, Q10 alpha chain-like n=1 Tax=Anolis sagrei TaxID=38937 RepID=UPI0035227CC0
MGLMWSPPFLLGLAALLAGTCSGSSSHSMRFFITSVSEPGLQVPQFSYVGYVDDQEFVSYDASTKRYLPKVPWIRKVENYDPEYWKRNSQYAQGHEQTFQDHLVTLAKYYNQSGGLHTFQWMYGCEQRKDGSNGGYYQYGYDGRDYISFNKETLTWTAASVPAQITKRKWDTDDVENQHKKVYMEETCTEWLQRYLNYGKETFLRTEKPDVKVTRKADYDGMETLICRVGGFYPKEIDITWTKDGEVWMADTYHGLVSPNSDGTYYTWWSIMVDPKERDRYKCHVEHDGLLKPVDVAWEEPATKRVPIIACVSGVAVLIVLIVGMALIFAISKKRQDYSKAALESDQGPSSLSQHNHWPIFHEKGYGKSSTQDVFTGNLHRSWA